MKFSKTESLKEEFLEPFSEKENIDLIKRVISRIILLFIIIFVSRMVNNKVNKKIIIVFFMR